MFRMYGAEHFRDTYKTNREYEQIFDEISFAEFYYLTSQLIGYKDEYQVDLAAAADEFPFWFEVYVFEFCPALFQIFDHSELWNVAEWTSYLTLSYLLFLIGISGIVFNYKNFLVTMLTIELMYLGVVTGFIITSVFYFDAIGQIYALITLILAASESAIGLGMLIVLFRYGRSIEFTSYQEMRG
jgi:NADH-quinone oxidoreductase subunit K